MAVVFAAADSKLAEYVVTATLRASFLVQCYSRDRAASERPEECRSLRDRQRHRGRRGGAFNRLAPWTRRDARWHEWRETKRFGDEPPRRAELAARWCDRHSTDDLFRHAVAEARRDETLSAVVKILGAARDAEGVLLELVRRNGPVSDVQKAQMELETVTAELIPWLPLPGQADNGADNGDKQNRGGRKPDPEVAARRDSVLKLYNQNVKRRDIATRLNVFPGTVSDDIKALKAAGKLE